MCNLGAYVGFRNPAQPLNPSPSLYSQTLDAAKLVQPSSAASSPAPPSLPTATSGGYITGDLLPLSVAKSSQTLRCCGRYLLHRLFRRPPADPTTGVSPLASPSSRCKPPTFSSTPGETLASNSGVRQLLGFFCTPSVNNPSGEQGQRRAISAATFLLGLLHELVQPSSPSSLFCLLPEKAIAGSPPSSTALFPLVSFLVLVVSLDV